MQGFFTRGLNLNPRYQSAQQPYISHNTHTSYLKPASQSNSATKENQ
jgi:hypothetical protein